MTELELDLVSNTRIPRSVTSVALPDYAEHFRQTVLTDPTAVLHNPDLLPPRFDPRFASSGIVSARTPR